MPKLLRVTTVPMSLRYLLRGQMKYMTSKGIDVTMVSAEGAEIDEVVAYEGVEHAVFSLTRSITPIKDLSTIFRLARFIRKEQFDIVHSHTPKAGLISLIAAYLGGTKVRLHTIAGIPWMESSGFKRHLLRAVDRMTFLFATRVYSNSNALKEFILEQKLIKPEKLKVIADGSSNGIDTDFFSALAIDHNKSGFRKELGIPVDAFVFVFVGRVVKDKGMNQLASIFSQMSSHVHLLLVGPLEQQLDPISEESLNYFTNEPRVHLLGYQNDVRPFYKMSDALVFPSFREGFPNVPMQAGAMELPSIVTDINGCNEIVVDGNNGIVVPAKDSQALLKAMEFMVNQKDDYLRMKEKARPMIVSRFSQERIWSELYEDYIELLNKS